MADESARTDLAAKLGTTPERLRLLVQETLKRLPRQQYYVFRITGSQGAPPRSDRPRMIAAFPTPDDALAFAQRNGYGSNAQLRPVAATDLIVRMLTDEGIESILFLRGGAAEDVKGFGPGLKLRRDKLLEQLQNRMAAPVTAPPDLTAKHYDSLQFGVDFTDRAAFRAALAQAVEQIVATYEPPAGSIDTGPRSIYAATAVEEWLKQHGFPHTHQRRWVNVAGDPRWNGAVELCEIDGGTANHLVVQLVIHEDEAGRQFIKWVNVTPE